MDFTNLRVDIFYPVYDSKEGSKITPGPDYDFPKVFDATSEQYHTKVNAQIEKSRYAGKLCLDNDYDYLLYVSDTIVAPENALQLLITEEKDWITTFVQQPTKADVLWEYGGRILDVEGPQDSDDRPIELHRDFEIGDVVKITRGVAAFFLMSRKIFEFNDYGGFHEQGIWSWLQGHGIQMFMHTGVMVKGLVGSDSCGHLAIAKIKGG